MGLPCRVHACGQASGQACGFALLKASNFDSSPCMHQHVDVVAWCGVVWCGVVWRGVAWCSVSWRRAVRRSVVRCELACLHRQNAPHLDHAQTPGPPKLTLLASCQSMAWHGKFRYKSAAQHTTAHHGTRWPATSQHGTPQNVTIQQNTPQHATSSHTTRHSCYNPAHMQSLSAHTWTYTCPHARARARTVTRSSSCCWRPVTAPVPCMD